MLDAIRQTADRSLCRFIVIQSVSRTRMPPIQT